MPPELLRQKLPGQLLLQLGGIEKFLLRNQAASLTGLQPIMSASSATLCGMPICDFMSCSLDKSRTMVTSPVCTR